MFDFFKKLFSDEGKEKDPVCGMSVDPKTALPTVYAGKQYYFCSENCRSKFTSQPGQAPTQNSGGGGKCC